MRWPNTKRENLLFVAWIVQFFIPIIIQESDPAGWVGNFLLFLLGMLPWVLVLQFLVGDKQGEKS